MPPSGPRPPTPSSSSYQLPPSPLLGFAVPPVITKIKARQILDSRGIPTVEVDLYTNKGMYRASVPSGASAGMYVDRLPPPL
ncbi:hypothetical protein BHE74_00023749 [Ensete ventricosum]|nr:hypothetical protein GW17_00012066 [Ensete ventricosum]RWW68721.1 hypothetical protein BHE74_00023749 [Ensete ventricosum]RZS02339.1 hypothetical protein BHM03_00032383 [Ensete ventricosum]